jgi:flagellar biosynthesis anti-sigma factor FlgM
VTITSTAALLAHLQQAFAAQSPVDSKRVDSISKALAAGSYTINADRITNGLIHIERSLGQLRER